MLNGFLEAPARRIDQTLQQADLPRTPDAARTTGNPEVIPGQKSDSGKSKIAEPGRIEVPARPWPK